MIIVKIKGGLGNQLFQYAYGRYLSLKLNKKLKFDLSFYQQQDFRKFELQCFNVNHSGLINFKDKIFIKGAHHFPKFFNNYLIKESGDNFDSPILDVDKNYYVDGYWQSDRFFKSIADVLKKDFQIKESLSDANKSLIKTIKNTNSVSVHFRRGDYVSIPANKDYNVCTKEYYSKALEIIESKTKDPRYFVFSDDIEWVKNNIKFKHKHTFIDNNVNKSYVDLYLMSLCEHNIMANSTFSWWASWLNQNPKKIVIAPRFWRIGEKRQELYTDFQIMI